jgi:hypothetical protein
LSSKVLLWIRIRIRVRIELNFWIRIRIRIRIESIRIHNPGLNKHDSTIIPVIFRLDRGITDKKATDTYEQGGDWDGAVLALDKGVLLSAHTRLIQLGWSRNYEPRK